MTKQWVSDFHFGRRGQSITHKIARTCVACGEKLEGTWLYCNHTCALESLRKKWVETHKDEPLPQRLASLQNYEAWLAA